MRKGVKKHKCSACCQSYKKPTLEYGFATLFSKVWFCYTFFKSMVLLHFFQKCFFQKCLYISMANVPNPFTSLFWFFIITTVYFILKYKITDATQSKIYSGVYILLLIVGEFIINLNLTDSMCGTKQYDTALFITLVPWLFIFGLLYVVLSIFPGWLAPFSNTFGYGIAKLAGLTNFFNDILKAKIDLGSKDSGEMGEALEHIYSDKSLLINEITQSNLDRFWANMKAIFKPSSYTDANKEALLGYIRLKDNVSEYIWYMLTGTLVTSVSYNYVVNKGCSQSVKEMKKRRKAYEERLEAKQLTAKDKPKVYSTTE